jgi:hypothetical protein
VLQAFDGGADGDVAGHVERHESAGAHPVVVRLVRRYAAELQPQRIVRVPGPDDVEAAALGHLDHGVAGLGVDAAPLADHPERVPPGHGDAVDGQRLPVGQVGDHAVRPGRPFAGRVGEAPGGAGEEVQAGDGQEPVRVGQLTFVLGVPLRPGLCGHEPERIPTWAIGKRPPASRTCDRTV